MASPPQVPDLHLLVERLDDGEVSPYLTDAAPTEADLLARDVLGPETTVTLTRTAPPGWLGETGRIDAGMLERRTVAPPERPRIFVCGNTTFAEFVATTLVDLGHDPSSIKIERFGNSGEPP